MVRNDFFEELTRKELLSYCGGVEYCIIYKGGEMYIIQIGNEGEVRELNSGKDNISLTNR